MGHTEIAERSGATSSRPISGAGGAVAVREGERLLYRRPGLPDAPVVGACLSITSRCNEACPMCLEERDPARPEDLPLDEAVALATLFAGAVPVINSSASEALLHPGFLELCRAVRARGSAMGVVTNGLALARPGYLGDCAEAGLRQVMISCHTADPGTFGRLTGAPRAYGAYLAALDALDAHNRAAPPGGQVEVLVQVVLTRPLLQELEALLAFLERRLAHSRASLRVETFRPINAGARHPELQPDLAEVASLVHRVRAAARLPVAFRHVPLCLLEGAEPLATEVGQILRREKTLGNFDCRSTALVEQARARSALGDLGIEACATCPLALVCPGASDLPFPPGGGPRAGPRPSLDEVAGRLDPALSGAALEASARAAGAELLGEPAGRFDPADLPRLGSLVARVRSTGLAVAASLRQIDLHLPDPDQPGGAARLILVPATAPGPRYRIFGGCAVGYDGVLSPRVQAAVASIGRHLQEGSP